MIFNKRIIVSTLTLATLQIFFSCHGGLLEDIENGNSLEGRKIEVKITKAFPDVPGMGFGDQFQFTSPYVERLLDKGAEKVVVNVSKPLKILFTQTTKINLKDETDTTKYEPVELADLYRTLDKNIPNFNRIASVLTCPEERIIKWHNIIKDKTGGKLIPVVFFTLGAPHHPERFPTTQEWDKLTKNMSKFYFFNGQFKGDDIKNSTRPSELDKNFDKDPFMDTLALTAAVITLHNGFVISPDTGTVHLSAAGVEGNKKAKRKVLLPLAEKPDQRWGNEYTKTIKTKKNGTTLKTSCWYPESVLIIQQEKTGDFSKVIKSMKNLMRKAIEEKN
jgi:hypothetical protein